MKARTILTKLFVFSSSFIPILLLTIVFGLLGFISAHGITILATLAIFKHFAIGPFLPSLSYPAIFALMIICGVLRGLFRYAEHLTGHYTAFVMLANIRAKIFAKLSLLSPARLEQKDKGDLITLITSDIEMLEIFYAHTIAPIMIYVIHSLLMVTTFALLGVWQLGIIALLLYLTIGVLIPVTKGKKTKQHAGEYRTNFAYLSSRFVDSLYGSKDLITLGKIKENNAKLSSYTDEIEKKNKNFKFAFSSLKALSDLTVYIFIVAFLLVAFLIFKSGSINEFVLIMSFVLLLGSFGPSLALNNLPSTLSHTLAAGERILTFLNEKPLVELKTNGQDFTYENAKLNNVSFKYSDEEVLENVSLTFEKGKIYGILGPSGSGKSTILKLLLRFYDVNTGEVLLNNININDINTASLYTNVAYMSQDTYIFNSTLRENILLNKVVSEDELKNVLEKAALTTFIASLPNGIDTNAGELGSRLSGGEKQRLGLARTFLHGGNLVLVDEPTSNVDALSEALILQALVALSKDKTIILVSHRPSTLKIADVIINMNDIIK